MTEITIKRGQSFSFAATLTAVHEGSEITDLTGWTAHCQIRDSAGALVETLICTWIDAAARRVRVRSASTAAWPSRGAGLIDILLINAAGTIRLPSGTWTLNFGTGVTNV